MVLIFINIVEFPTKITLSFVKVQKVFDKCVTFLLNLNKYYVIAINHTLSTNYNLYILNTYNHHLVKAKIYFHYNNRKTHSPETNDEESIEKSLMQSDITWRILYHLLR